MTRKLKEVTFTISEKSFVLEGEVISAKMDKTVVVKVTRILKHPVLGKTIKRFKKYKAHDEQGSAKCGDWVEIVGCRPLSKTKHMVLSRVLRTSR